MEDKYQLSHSDDKKMEILYTSNCKTVPKKKKKKNI